MKNRFFFFFVLVFSITSFEAMGDIKDSLDGMVEAFNDQDCVAYSSYFTQSCKSKARRDAGLFFALNNATVSLEENHILVEDEAFAEVAVSYVLRTSDGSKNLTSRLFLEKEDGSWKLKKEIFLAPKEKDASNRLASQRSFSSNPFVPNQPVTSNAPAQSQSCPGGSCSPTNPFNVIQACRDFGLSPINCQDGSCNR